MVGALVVGSSSALSVSEVALGAVEAAADVGGVVHQATLALGLSQQLHTTCPVRQCALLLEADADAGVQAAGDLDVH